MCDSKTKLSLSRNRMKVVRPLNKKGYCCKNACTCGKYCEKCNNDKVLRHTVYVCTDEMK